MGRLLRTLAVWALFIVAGPLGGLALFLTVGVSAAGVIPQMPTARDGQALGQLTALAYVLGAGPMFIAGLFAAVISSFIRRGSLWLMVAMLTTTACMWVVVAALMSAGGAFSWGASLLFSLVGTAAGLLAGALALPMRPRPEPRSER